MTKKLLAVIGAALLLATGSGCAQDSAAETQPVEVGVNLNGTIKEKFFVGTAVLWPDPSNIPVCWEMSGLAHEKQVIKDSVKKAWETGSSVRFTGWGQCSAGSPGIHIVNKVDTEAGPHVEDFGKKLDGMQNGMVLDMELKDDAIFANCHDDQEKLDRCNRSVAAHEFGHALGFYHEQERQDTPSSCPDRDTSFPPESTDKTIGKWDLMSIMNYCYPDRLEVYPDQLSALDKAGLLSVYPPIEASPTQDDDESGPSTQSTDDDDDDRSSDDEDADDEDDKPKKKKKSSSRGSATTPSAGCSASPASASPDYGWLLGLALALTATRKKKREAQA